MNIRKSLKRNPAKWALAVFILIFAGMIFWTANLFYGSRNRFVSPATPETPGAAGSTCVVAFRIPTPTAQPSLTPTPTTTSSVCNVTMELEDTAVCWHDTRTVAVKYTVNSLPSTGGPFYIQTQWRQVLPTESQDYHYVKTGPINAGQTGTINVNWPGVQVGQTATSETHARATVLKADGTPVQNCSDGMDYYWTPFICAAPTPTSGATSSVNLISNPSFEQAISNPWQREMYNGANGNLTRDLTSFSDGLASARMDISATTSTDWHLQLSHPNISLQQGVTYKVSFYAKAASARSIGAMVEMTNSPYTTYWQSNVNLTTSWQRYQYTFVAPANISNAKLGFRFATNSSTVWIDNVYVGK